MGDDNHLTDIIGDEDEKARVSGQFRGRDTPKRKGTPRLPHVGGLPYCSDMGNEAHRKRRNEMSNKQLIGTRQDKAGTTTIGTKTARQVSSKVVADLTALGLRPGGHERYNYTTRAWMGGVSVHIPPHPIKRMSADELQAALEAMGYTVTPVELYGEVQSLRLSHPFWAEAK